MGAVTGSLERPQVLVVGRYRGEEFELIGRTVKLTEAQSTAIGKLLKPAGARHPWPDQISTHSSRDSKTRSSKSARRWWSPACTPAEGELVVVGRTVPLKPNQSAQLAAVLSPATRGHPWPDEITSYRWGGPDSKKPLTKVQPTVVAEVAADAATQAGQARHGCATSATAPTCDRTTSRPCRTASSDRLHCNLLKDIGDLKPRNEDIGYRRGCAVYICDH